MGLLLLVFGSRAATLRGRVTGGPANDALIGAVVVMQGTAFNAPVDASGRYEI